MTDTNQSVRAARVFEFYVRRVWPLHRLVVPGRYAKRCRGCAASEAMTRLDGSGRCELCQTAAATGQAAPGGPGGPGGPGSDESRRALADILRAHQGRGAGGYDAVVAFSGGKDSAYLVRRIRDEFPGLRLLAYTLDNGFMSPVAQANVRRLVDQLGIDHVTIRPRQSFYVTLFRHCLTHLGPGGGYATVDFSDGEFMLDTARNLAAEKNIPLILCGYSRYQVQDGLNLRHFESPRAVELADRTHTAGIPLSDIFDPADLGLWWRASRWPQERVARLLFPLYAWDPRLSQFWVAGRRWV